MVVKVLDPVRFPNGGWLSSNAIGPHNGRMLVEIRGHSGMSSWCNGLLTCPENAITVEQKYEWASKKIHLLPGNYEVQDGQDKRGQRIIRFYHTTEEPNLVLFPAYGFLVPEASTDNVQHLLECEGYSRTGRNGDRWSLIIAPIGAVVAIEPYDSNNDPVYYRVSANGIENLGITDAVLHPDEW